MTSRRVAMLVAAASVVGVALLVTALLGGFAASAPAGLRTVEPGEEVEVAPLRWRLDSARAAYVVGDREAEPGQVFVLVDGELASTDDEPVTVGTVEDALSVDLLGGLDPYGAPTSEVDPLVTVAEDGSTLIGIGPGLVYPVRLVYVVERALVPEQMTVTLHAHVRRDSALDGTPGWFDPAPAAEVTLDVAPPPTPPDGGPF